MNIIEKYKDYKNQIATINIVVNSAFNYDSHELNVLKECLNSWSNEDRYGVPIKFNWMYVNPDLKEKVFFVSTNLRQLKRMKLDKAINNLTLESSSYITPEIHNYVFPMLYKKDIK